MKKIINVLIAIAFVIIWITWMVISVGITSSAALNYFIVVAGTGIILYVYYLIKTRREKKHAEKTGRGDLDRQP